MANMQVTVVDGNNVTVSLDRGVAGVGIASISLVVINQANYLLITYTNGTTQTVGPVGVIQYNATTPINISGSTISLLTVPVNLGGTGQTTAAAGLNALLPVQTSQANKYLQTDGTNASWDAVSLSTADITGILPVANGGTGVSTSTGTGNTVLSTSPTLVTPVLGTPASGTLTNATGLPVATGISGLGTGIATFLATPSSANLAASLTDETGTGAAVFATSPTLVTPALGTPASGVMTNVTGTAAGLTAGNVTTNANLTGDITSVGNATAIAAGVIVNADINASAAIADTKLATIATALKVSNSATTAASANTASAIVARDASGNFAAGIVTAALTGNASTATALATGRTIAITGDLAYTSPSFDGSANVTAAGTLATVATAGVTGSSTAIPVVTINAKGLTTSITTAAVIAPAGTLSGSTLAAGVTGSSLTSLGTIANLSVTAGTISTTPSASTDIANKDYVDTVAQGLDPKASCVAATTANITLSGTQTIDGVALIAADRCLVKNQTAPAENGIYVVAAGAWARSADMNAWLEVPGAFTFIEQGTTQADTGWVCTSNAGGTLGTTAITFVQFAGAGSYTASTGLTLTGTAFSLTSPVTVALGGTNATSAGIASFNNITGYTAAGATGTTSTNLVFSTSPTLVTPILGTPQSATLTNATGLPLTTGVTGTLPVANGGTGLTAGTSGGVLAYTATGTLASSAALTQYGVVYGGGAGAVPVATAAGTTGQVLQATTGGAPVWGSTYAGTVTSVAQSFTGGLISVAGSPITTSGTLALTVAGTSGGVPYFSSGTTWATSAALAANALVIGGGAGAAPSTTTTGTGVVTALGVNTGTAGAFVVNGGALGTPSSGTVTNLTGTASININGTVGATTANTGAFTTLSATGVLNLSGLNQIHQLSGHNFVQGDAGRTYLYGGTSGIQFRTSNNVTALFEMTDAGQFSFSPAGTTTAVISSTGLAVTGAISATTTIRTSDGSVATPTLSFTNETGTGLYRSNNGAMSVAILGAEVSRFTASGLAVTGTLSATGTLSGGTSGTAYSFSGSAPATSLTLNSSGNVGIGTASPAAKLQVNAATDTIKTLGTSYNQQIYDCSTGFSQAVWQYIGTTKALVGANSTSMILNTGGDATAVMVFSTGSGTTERMRLDSSGNLLVGTTTTVTGSNHVVVGSNAIQGFKQNFTNLGTTAQSFGFNAAGPGVYVCNMKSIGGASVAFLISVVYNNSAIDMYTTALGNCTAGGNTATITGINGDTRIYTFIRNSSTGLFEVTASTTATGTTTFYMTPFNVFA